MYKNGTSSKHTRYVMDEEHSCNEPEARMGIKYPPLYIDLPDLLFVDCKQLLLSKMATTTGWQALYTGSRVSDLTSFN